MISNIRYMEGAFWFHGTRCRFKEQRRHVAFARSCSVQEAFQGAVKKIIRIHSQKSHVSRDWVLHRYFSSNKWGALTSRQEAGGTYHQNHTVINQSQMHHMLVRNHWQWLESWCMATPMSWTLHSNLAGKTLWSWRIQLEKFDQKILRINLGSRWWPTPLAGLALALQLFWLQSYQTVSWVILAHPKKLLSFNFNDTLCMQIPNMTIYGNCTRCLYTVNVS